MLIFVSEMTIQVDFLVRILQAVVDAGATTRAAALLPAFDNATNYAI